MLARLWSSIKCNKAVFAAGLFVIGTLPVAANAQSWKAENVVVDATVQQDGIVHVEEQIDAVSLDGENQITLILPIQYHPNYGRVEIEHMNVSAEFRVEDGIDRVELFITLPQSVSTVEVTYDMVRSIQRANGRDSLEWTVLPIARSFDADHVEARVHLPKAYAVSEVNAQLVRGSHNDERQSDEKIVTENGIVVFTGAGVSANEQFTLTAEWPAGDSTLAPASFETRLWRVISYPYNISPALLFVFLLYWFLRYGRDPRGHKSVRLRTEPPHDLSPAHLGALLDERVKIHSIIAILVDLAQRGFIQIIEEPRKSVFSKKEYTFVKKKNFRGDPNVNDVELFFLQGLFGPEGHIVGPSESVKLSALKNRFSSRIHVLRRMVMKNLVKRKYFRGDPNMVRGKYTVVATVIMFIALPAWLIGAVVYGNIFAGVPLLLIAGLFFFFGPFMPQRTKSGVLAVEWAEGFRTFLTDPQKANARLTPELFGRYLPYAMVFEVEKEWAKAFESVLTKLPQWYVATGSFESFSSTDFSHSLKSSFVHAASQTLQNTGGSK